MWGQSAREIQHGQRKPTRCCAAARTLSLGRRSRRFRVLAVVCDRCGGRDARADGVEQNHDRASESTLLELPSANVAVAGRPAASAYALRGARRRRHRRRRDALQYLPQGFRQRPDVRHPRRAALAARPGLDGVAGSVVYAAVCRAERPQEQRRSQRQRLDSAYECRAAGALGLDAGREIEAGADRARRFHDPHAPMGRERHAVPK